ncbi:MAG: glycosyltransferase family 92 protein [Lachnospiraceae bacterium]|nr:glycosyltransferase family 92 protein [Lachnospiraceae bacterium]
MDLKAVKEIVKLIPRAYCRLRFEFSGQGGRKQALAVVVIVKNEELYIREWIEYHRLAGISHIYLYDNGSTDKTAEYVRPYAEEGFVTMTYLPGRGMQTVAYNDALKKYGKDCRYMAFIDADEFLFSVKPDRKLPEVVEEIMKENPKACGLAVNWAMFGSAGFKECPKSGGVLSNYVYRAGPGKRGTDCVKTIVRPETVYRYNHPHFPEYMLGGFSVDENGRRAEGGRNPGPEPVRIRVNHYFTKSEEEWTERRKLGKADKKDEKDVRTIDEFYRHDNNDVFDDSMSAFAAAIEERIGNTVYEAE